MTPFRLRPRRSSRALFLKNLQIGGDAPIRVQSMTNTPTSDLEATTAQIMALKEAGADLVRLAVHNFEAAEAFRKLSQRFGDYPLVADVHFDWRLAIASIKAGAAGLRVNPGNLGDPYRAKAVIKLAKAAQVPIRIGVNGGSLPLDLISMAESDLAGAMVAAAHLHMRCCEEEHFEDFKVSLKATDVQATWEANQLLAQQIKQPIHLGITESGSATTGSIRSSLGLGLLLALGIGETLRVSLAADPVEEIRVGFEILKTLGLVRRGLSVTACPTCARAHFDVVGVTQALERRFADEVTPIDVAIMGCEVNGPGECRRVELGLSGAPGSSLIYCDGKKEKNRLANEAVVEGMSRRIEDKIRSIQEAARRRELEDHGKA